MLIVGTIIGAGFASGAEMVSFFGKKGISPLTAVICGVLIFLCCALFLYLGSKLRPKDVGELNLKTTGKLHTACDIFLLINSLIVTAGMLAAFTTIGQSVYSPFPLYSLVFGIIAAIVVCKGIRSVIKVNAVVLPVVIITMITVCALSLNHAVLDCDFFQAKPLMSLVYVCMNMVLACSALTSVHKLKPKEIILSALFAAVVICALMIMLIFALNSTGDFYTALPTLSMAKNISPILFGLMLAAMSVSVFTTLLTAMNCLTDYAAGIFKNRKISAFVVLIVGLVLSNLGFEKVVGLLYPVIGGVGACYIIINFIYVARHSPLLRARRGRKRAPDKALPSASHTLLD